MRDSLSSRILWPALQYLHGSPPNPRLRQRIPWTTPRASIAFATASGLFRRGLRAIFHYISKEGPAVEGSRVLNPALRSKIMTSSEAAALIPAGSNVGMSGFTGSGYPKAVPAALAERINALRSTGEKFKISIWTGASTAPELDGALASVDGIEMRLPYQSDPTCRARINAGQMEYIDIHLSQVAQFVWFRLFRQAGRFHCRGRGHFGRWAAQASYLHRQ